MLQGLERGADAVIELGLGDVPRMGQILAKYPASDLADASLIVVAERLGVTDIATLDRLDFGIYRTRHGRAFANCF
ncbi:MAG: hypothetical protein IT514_00580 [Burkholderiales bacterium]|nr:hypothetical protein [Burkholderiales bacterium]